MIAKLTGLLDAIGIDEVVIDVNGVGYLVFCSARTLRSFEKAGDPITIFVETHVRVDHIHLFGFGDQNERDWFRLLTTVQGVGAKVALAILGFRSWTRSPMIPELKTKNMSGCSKTIIR